MERIWRSDWETRTVHVCGIRIYKLKITWGV